MYGLSLFIQIVTALYGMARFEWGGSSILLILIVGALIMIIAGYVPKKGIRIEEVQEVETCLAYTGISFLVFSILNGFDHPVSIKAKCPKNHQVSAPDKYGTCKVVPKSGI